MEKKRLEKEILRTWHSFRKRTVFVLEEEIETKSLGLYKGAPVVLTYNGSRKRRPKQPSV